ncbi:UPF0669 protein C6orf120 homolog [Aricia agestis]|uniref:UPF0669 protein C6orf120 homolog n=1 Tax=Aricia agestis TaxID=91739 RepID=UPI001C2037DD|nr:UPF0669 protein C6orf120 homolog [Aricia agestis]
MDVLLVYLTLLVSFFFIYTINEMRRKVILVLLAIILTSTLSTLFTGYVQIETDKVLLDTVAGSVGAGNFSYWQLGHIGPLLLELNSLTGDADLYVADTVRPGYEVDKNNFSSATCGPDVVNIPADFPRPIGIGVFGDWSHALSEFSIQVFLDTSAILSEEQLLAIERAHQIPDRSDIQIEAKKSKEKIATKKTEEERPRFLRLLNMLDAIFEMFLL